MTEANFTATQEWFMAMCDTLDELNQQWDVNGFLRDSERKAIEAPLFAFAKANGFHSWRECYRAALKEKYSGISLS